MQCTFCEPERFPEAMRSAERVSEQHVSVRFSHRQDQRPYLNGIEVAGSFEALVGPDGWVAFYPRSVGDDGEAHYMICEGCHAHAVADILYGDVTLKGRE